MESHFSHYCFRLPLFPFPPRHPRSELSVARIDAYCELLKERRIRDLKITGDNLDSSFLNPRSTIPTQQSQSEDDIPEATLLVSN